MVQFPALLSQIQLTPEQHKFELPGLFKRRVFFSQGIVGPPIPGFHVHGFNQLLIENRISCLELGISIFEFANMELRLK